MTGSLILLMQGIVYFTVMAALFGARRRLGIGVFVCALGVMHFVETYLAAVFFIRLPFGLISPGSTVMFAGKLAMILMLYIKEDAETVRQPIYGLLVGNFLMVALVGILRLSPAPEMLDGYNSDLRFLDQMGALMVWGTALLFIDSIAMILLYEKLRKPLGAIPVLRTFVTLACILTFDQWLFFFGLKLIAGTPDTALLGGWLAKIGAAAVYTVLLGVYFRWIEPKAATRDAASVGDLFDRLTYRHKYLTYRHKYNTLLERSAVDELTGAFNRRHFETIATKSLAHALATGTPLSLAIIDVDHFKQINDRYGHAAGDDALRQIASALREAVRDTDTVFRYGGEEFIVLCEGLNHDAVLAQAERLRAAVPAAFGDALDPPPTVSIGVATIPDDAATIADLLRQADLNLYQAKNDGRDQVAGTRAIDGMIEGAPA